MAFIISITGKGGAGKTTFAGILIKELIKKGRVLAIDADPSSNLNEVLGVELDSTVGSVRESVLNESLPEGITKQEYLKLHLESSIVEAKGFDLLAMGRPEGPGCYCYANSLIRDYIDILKDNYDYVVVDNEAGLENLSRRIVEATDVLFILTNNTKRNLLCAFRINKISKEVKINIKKVFLIANRTDNITEETKNQIKENGMELEALIPDDKCVAEYDNINRPLLELDDDSEAVIAVQKIIEKILNV